MKSDYEVSATQFGKDALYLDWFAVKVRGKGNGRKFYEEWESQLPSWVKYIYLHAADSGHGPTDDFWDAMGYSYVYSCEDESILSYEDAHYMVKAIHGAKPKKTIWVEEEEEDD